MKILNFELKVIKNLICLCLGNPSNIELRKIYSHTNNAWSQISSDLSCSYRRSENSVLKKLKYHFSVHRSEFSLQSVWGCELRAVPAAALLLQWEAVQGPQPGHHLPPLPPHSHLLLLPHQEQRRPASQQALRKNWLSSKHHIIYWEGVDGA